jgi:hypothetical protein
LRKAFQLATEPTPGAVCNPMREKDFSKFGYTDVLFPGRYERRMTRSEIA